MGSARIDDEVARFALKAERYAGAISRQPLARTFEAVPVLAALESIVPPDRRAATTICDLMAGNGFLASRLAPLGCRIVAAEACTAFADSEPVDFERIPFSGLAEIPHLLAKIGTDIAVAHVAFHHILAKERGIVDRSASTVLQADLVEACFRASPRLSAFVIADVPDSQGDKRGDFPWGSNTPAAWLKLLEPLGPDISDPFGGVRNAAGYLRQLDWALPTTRPAAWFREIVDPNSITGHDDCFLDGGLATALEARGFRVATETFPTPWLFRTQGDLDSYIWDQFAFDESRSRLTPTAATHTAGEYLGLGLAFGMIALGWRLQYSVITR